MAVYGAPVPDWERAPTTRINEKAALWGGLFIYPGDDLLSQGLAPQVPSALRGLTSLFGMGKGVSPSL